MSRPRRSVRDRVMVLAVQQVVGSDDASPTRRLIRWMAVDGVPPDRRPSGAVRAVGCKKTARGNAEETASTSEPTSRRFAAGMSATVGDCVVTAEPTTEQTGQKCVAEGEAVRSVQKWNCAPRKIIPRSNATTRTRYALLRMCLIRRSLCPNGCRVKRPLALPVPG